MQTRERDCDASSRNHQRRTYAKNKPLQATAYHEAGHAFADWKFGFKVKRATIVPKDGALGSTGFLEFSQDFARQTLTARV